jgi:lactoylglutathione lyase
MAKSYAQEKPLLQNNLRGDQHLGIPVVDINAAKEWYIKTLGFRVVHEPNVPTKDGVIQVAFLKKNNVTIELYQLTGKDLAEIKTRTNGHIDHFAIDVADINKALAEALAAGAKLDESTPDGPKFISTFFSKGVKYVVLKGPTGEKVELNQRLDLKPSAAGQTIRGWSHLGIPVTDINESRNFYARFGFVDIMSAEIPQTGCAIKCSMMQKDGFTIELYQLCGDALKEISKRKDGRIDHIALDVADINAAYDELKKAGFVIFEDAPVYLAFWEKGIKYFNIRGPCGEKLEFCQILN